MLKRGAARAASVAQVWHRQLSASTVGSTTSSGDASVTLHDDYLRFSADGLRNTHDFHYFFLLHNCPCTSRCCHPKTLERQLDVPDIPLDVQPRSVDIHNGVMYVAWPGNHTSEYSLDWLLKCSYAPNRAAVEPPSNDMSRIEIDYAKRIDDATYMQEVFHNFKAYGAAVVRNRGMDTEEIIDEFGGKVWESHFGRIEDLRTDNTTNKHTDQLGYTNAAVAPHTDMPFVDHPPAIQLLHAQQPAERGGQSYLVDARQAAEFLRKTNPWAFDMLRTTPITFHREQQEFEAVTRFPLIECRGDHIEQVRYSYFTMAPFKVPFEWMKLWYTAYAAFSNILRAPEYQYRFLLGPGDYVVYSNKTCVHAREAFSGSRWLRGVYFEESVFLEGVSKSMKRKQ